MKYLFIIVRKDLNHNKKKKGNVFIEWNLGSNDIFHLKEQFSLWYSIIVNIFWHALFALQTKYERVDWLNNFRCFLYSFSEGRDKQQKQVIRSDLQTILCVIQAVYGPWKRTKNTNYMELGSVKCQLPVNFVMFSSANVVGDRYWFG